jgi:hypothetical protein
VSIEESSLDHVSGVYACDFTGFLSKASLLERCGSPMPRSHALDFNTESSV